ncbi:hypothetical protein ON010_g10321 [Phytophthora cinnamomi]|nr:hypothetical protein ON010_g10321 [Phytophthora cinnamomi]
MEWAELPTLQQLIEIPVRKKMPRVVQDDDRYHELELQELLFLLGRTDMDQQLVVLKDGSVTCVTGTRSRPPSVPSHDEVTVQVDSQSWGDTVFNGMLVLSPPSSERFDRLRVFVDAGTDCVNTPEEVVALAITFDKANQADSQLNRSFSSGISSAGQQNKGGGSAGYRWQRSWQVEMKRKDVLIFGWSQRGPADEGPRNAETAANEDDNADQHNANNTEISILLPTPILSPSIVVRIAGLGTITLVNEVDDDQVAMYVDDGFYVPDAEYGLFSPGFSYEQGVKFDYDSPTRNFIISGEATRVAVTTPQKSTWDFQPFHGSAAAPEVRPLLVNYTVAEGVGNSGMSTCATLPKTMVDTEYECDLDDEAITVASGFVPRENEEDTAGLNISGQKVAPGEADIVERLDPSFVDEYATNREVVVDPVVLFAPSPNQT